MSPEEEKCIFGGPQMEIASLKAQLATKDIAIRVDDTHFVYGDLESTRILQDKMFMLEASVAWLKAKAIEERATRLRDSLSFMEKYPDEKIIYKTYKTDSENQAARELEEEMRKSIN